MRIKLLVSVNLFRAYVSIYKLHERPIVREQPFTVSYADPHCGKGKQQNLREHF